MRFIPYIAAITVFLQAARAAVKYFTDMKARRGCGGCHMCECSGCDRSVK